MNMQAPEPIKVLLNENKNGLEITFENLEVFYFPAEYLRQNSPSAEHRGHGIEKNNICNKRYPDITIKNMNKVGEYAIQLHFSDQHKTGYYTWDFLYQLGIKKKASEAS